jgi:hypothetical protein
MAFVPRPNTGTLWPNDKRTSDNQPNVRGDIFVDKELIQKLLKEAENGMVQLSLAGWTKELAGKKALTLKVSEPYKKAAPVASSDEEDLPF